MIDFFENIGKYKKGELIGEDLIAFEAELVRNKELHNAISNHEVVEEIFELMLEDDIRQVIQDSTVNSINATEGNPKDDDKVSETRNNLKWFIIVAAAVALLVVGYLLLKQTSRSSGMELYAKHLTAFIFPDIRSGEARDPINLSPCQLGHYYLEEKEEFELAKQIFEEDLESNSIDCKDKSQWYLCLYHLRFENIDERDRLLNQILNDEDHLYYKNALRLRADLE